MWERATAATATGDGEAGAGESGEGRGGAGERETHVPHASTVHSHTACTRASARHAGVRSTRDGHGTLMHAARRSLALVSASSTGPPVTGPARWAVRYTHAIVSRALSRYTRTVDAASASDTPVDTWQHERWGVAHVVTRVPHVDYGNRGSDSPPLLHPTSPPLTHPTSPHSHTRRYPHNNLPASQPPHDTNPSIKGGCVCTRLAAHPELPRCQPGEQRRAGPTGC